MVPRVTYRYRVELLKVVLAPIDMPVIIKI